MNKNLFFITFPIQASSALSTVGSGVSPAVGGGSKPVNAGGVSNKAVTGSSDGAAGAAVPGNDANSAAARGATCLFDIGSPCSAVACGTASSVLTDGAADSRAGSAVPIGNVVQCCVSRSGQIKAFFVGSGSTQLSGSGSDYKKQERNIFFKYIFKNITIKF